jgi:hypothetical protein
MDDETTIYEDDSAKHNPIANAKRADEGRQSAKQHFEENRRRIEAIDKELEELEKQFYDATTKKAIELEGIGETEDEEIDKHRHLYEMMQLQKLERKLRRIE